MRVIVVEEPAREVVRKFLITEKDISIIGEFGDGFSAAVAINRDKPDLVLLDIQLPRLNGFEILEVLDCSPQIIFTTAYDDYAIKAFEENATDYLLKPFSKERLLVALAKAKDKYLSFSKQEAPVRSMAQNLSSSLPLNRLVVKDNKGIHIISSNDIQYIEAQDDYIMIYSKQGRFIKKQTMKNVENRLNPQHFIRTHRSFIVNVLEISRIEPYERDSYIVVLKSGDKVKASATGYKSLRDQLEF